VDAWRTPQGIRASYGLNQLADLLAYWRTANPFPRLARQMRPIPAKTLSLPTHDSVWMYDD
jgi:hypothetical protein